jgi:hypothetical protein
LVDERERWVAGTGLRAMRCDCGGRTTGFEVGFVDEREGEVRMSLGDAAAAPFERAALARSFPVYKGQRNFPRFYYAATMGAHVAFESWLERDTAMAMAMDFDDDVVSFAAQPFWLSWAGTDRARSHAPDFFARTADGTGVVVDCRPRTGSHRVKPRPSPRPNAPASRSAGSTG